jgi:hypothetical protein
MKSMVLLLASFLIVSCNGVINSKLRVQNSTPLNAKYDGRVSLSPGSHDVRFSVNEKSKYIKMEFPLPNDPSLPPDDPNWNNRSYEVRFNYPEDSGFDGENGAFVLEPETSGQPVYLQGKVETVVEKKELRRGFESCQFQERRTDCYADSKGRVVCTDRWETVWGRREVDYYPIITTKTVDLVLSETLSSVPSADLRARENYERRDYVYQGFCRR